MKIFLLFSLFLISFVFSQRQQQTLFIDFDFSNGQTIANQLINLPSNFINPIQVQIIEGVTNVQLCVQANGLPYPNNFAETCSKGGSYNYPGVVNTTSISNSKITRKSLSVFEETKNYFEYNFGDSSNPNTTAYLNVTGGGFQYYASMVSNNSMTVSTTFTVDFCPDGFFGENCDETSIPFVEPSYTIQPAVNTWTYYSISAPENLGSITFTLSGTNLTNVGLYAQIGTVPTTLSYASTYNTVSTTNITATVLSPYDVYDRLWYIGILNNSTLDQQLTISYTVNLCNSSAFGYNCNLLYDSINVVDFNKTGFSYKKAASTSNINNYGLVFLTYNVSQLNNFTAEGNQTPFIRFSVGPKSGVNSLITYARLNSIPSQSFFDYNGTMEYVSQFILQNPGTGNGQWYFAVVANNDFYAWAGGNCYDCEDHGHCICDGQTCNNQTVFTYPTTSNDSFGMCVCDYSAYDKSFNCLVNPNAFSAVYIVLIVIGGAIVIAVAIGVPLYCYLKSRKRSSYDTI